MRRSHEHEKGPLGCPDDPPSRADESKCVSPEFRFVLPCPYWRHGSLSELSPSTIIITSVVSRKGRLASIRQHPGHRFVFLSLPLTHSTAARLSHRTQFAAPTLSFSIPELFFPVPYFPSALPESISISTSRGTAPEVGCLYRLGRLAAKS